RAATVDARLAADARVDHREQSGGHGHEPYPTLPDRGREASEVTHRPAADGYDTTAAVDLLPLQECEHVLQMGHRFGSLPSRHDMDRGLEPGSFDCLRDLAGPRPHVRIGDDRRAGGVEPRDRRTPLALDVGADPDGVAAHRRV